MLAFRDSAVVVRGETALAELSESLSRPRIEVSALIRAGTLECALADAALPGAERALRLTDAVADGWTGERSAYERARSLLLDLPVPETLTIRRPEGYAFYALDPRSYVTLAREHALSACRACVVIGIRSIGTSLSAVVRAELARQGIPTLRFTVRPLGSPFDRALEWSAAQLRILFRFGDNADYLVTDEGPGLSGSTFLAVGEALLALGVRAERITFLSSHAAGAPDRLLARDASARWGRFTCKPAAEFREPAASFDMSGGAWRALVCGTTRSWPPCWPEQERVKYLTFDRTHLVKFAGFSPYQDAPLERAELLANAGWGPPVVPAEPGFLAYRWLKGRPASPSRERQLAPHVIARYLAFRTGTEWRGFAEPDALLNMTRINVLEDTGIELPSDFGLAQHLVVHPDARLMPHEWVVTENQFMKTDGVDHGDDHLFPGPADVAFDLAGAIVEWAFDDAQAVALLDEFRRLTGDDARHRYLHYVVAYCACRIGISSFAEAASSGPERARWRSARTVYRIRLHRALEKLGLSQPIERSRTPHFKRRASPSRHRRVLRGVARPRD